MNVVYTSMMTEQTGIGQLLKIFFVKAFASGFAEYSVTFTETHYLYELTLI